LPGHVERDARLPNLRRFRPQTDVVPVERDVEHADGDPRPLDAIDLGSEAPGKVVPARGDADENEVGRSLVALEDLMGDAGHRTADLRGVQEASRCLRRHPAIPDEGGRKEGTPHRAAMERK
jgi:hypothetical protein